MKWWRFTSLSSMCGGRQKGREGGLNARARGKTSARGTRGERQGCPFPCPSRALHAHSRPCFFPRSLVLLPLPPLQTHYYHFWHKKATLSLFLTGNGTPSNEGSCGYGPPPQKKECFTPGLKLECLQWPDHFTLFNYCTRIFHNVIFLRGVPSRLCLQSSLCLAGVKRVIAPAFYTLIKISWIRPCNFTLKSIQKPLSMFKWTGYLANLF